MSDIENVRNAIQEASSGLGLDDPDNTWQRQSSAAARDIVHYAQRTLDSRQYDLEGHIDTVRRYIQNHYGENIAQRHARATKDLEQGHKDLQRLLDGTTNDHALRGIEEMATAHQLSVQADAKIQAIQEIYLLELGLRLQELNEALGSAANQLCIPFIGTEHLGNTNVTTMDWRSTEVSCSDVASPLQASHEAISKYLLEMFGVETSE